MHSFRRCRRGSVAGGGGLARGLCWRRRRMELSLCVNDGVCVVESTNYESMYIVCYTAMTMELCTVLNATVD